VEVELYLWKLISATFLPAASCCEAVIRLSCIIWWLTDALAECSCVLMNHLPVRKKMIEIFLVTLLCFNYKGMVGCSGILNICCVYCLYFMHKESCHIMVKINK